MESKMNGPNFRIYTVLFCLLFLFLVVHLTRYVPGICSADMLGFFCQLNYCYILKKFDHDHAKAGFWLTFSRSS